MRWEELANGTLLRTAAAAGFDVLLTNDKNMEYEQNLQNLPLPIILLDLQRNTLEHILQILPTLQQLLAAPLTPAMYVIDPEGAVARLNAPRE